MIVLMYMNKLFFFILTVFCFVFILLNQTKFASAQITCEGEAYCCASNNWYCRNTEDGTNLGSCDSGDEPGDLCKYNAGICTCWSDYVRDCNPSNSCRMYPCNVGDYLMDNFCQVCTISSLGCGPIGGCPLGYMRRCSSCGTNNCWCAQNYTACPFCGDGACVGSQGETCSTCVPDCGPCAVPSCTVSLLPSTATVNVGGTQSFTASVTPLNGSVDYVGFSSSNAYASVSPLSDNSVVYETTATGVNSGGTATITSSVVMSGVTRCAGTSTVTVNALTPTCSVDLLPSSITLNIGESTILNAAVTPITGTVDEVNFTSSDTDSVTIFPASVDISPYQTTATAIAVPDDLPPTITASVIMDGSSRCTDTAIVSVSAPVLDIPWWQVVDGDVTTLGDIKSDVPAGSIFDLDGAGNYPGIPVYGGSLNLASGTISSKQWNSSTSTLFSKRYDYTYFENLVPSDVTFIPILTSSVLGTFFESGGVAQYGYYWYLFDGSSGPTMGQDLTIDTKIDLTGNRKVILFVKSANLFINKKINLLDGSNFFAAFVNGNITIDPDISGNPTIEGIYEADGELFTGLGVDQFFLRGSITANKVNLQRDLADDTLPAEVFEFAPDQLLLFPPKLSTRNKKWQEIAP